MALNVKTPYSVLLVDDDPAIIELFLECLEDLSFQVFKASDGDEALTFLKSHKVDCIITDISMPRMPGPQMIKELRARSDETPFFYITGYLDYPREELNRYKPLAIIFKPFDFEEAALLVKNHMLKLK